MRNICNCNSCFCGLFFEGAISLVIECKTWYSTFKWCCGFYSDLQKNASDRYYKSAKRVAPFEWDVLLIAKLLSSCFSSLFWQIRSLFMDYIGPRNDTLKELDPQMLCWILRYKSILPSTLMDGFYIINSLLFISLSVALQILVSRFFFLYIINSLLFSCPCIKDAIV